MDGRRIASGRQRRSRLTVGGVATPLSIIVAYLFHEVLGKDMNTEVTIAVSSIIGSLVGAGSICFWDIRGILLSWFYRRRRSTNGQPQEPDSP